MSVRRKSQSYVGRNPGTSLDYLREKISELQEERDAKAQMLEVLMNSGQGGDEIDPTEERQVARRSAFLRRELARMQQAERQHATDARVMGKRNETKEVKRQIAIVEEEIATLRVMKKRRDKGLRAIEWGEENARRVRSENAEVNAELRLTLKEMTEKLKEVARKDYEAHERHAKLQEMVKLGATTDEVDQLQMEIASQREEIDKLQVKEAEWKKAKAGVRDENRKLAGAEQKAIKKLTADLSKLLVVLTEKEQELERMR